LQPVRLQIPQVHHFHHHPDFVYKEVNPIAKNKSYRLTFADCDVEDAAAVVVVDRRFDVVGCCFDGIIDTFSRKYIHKSTTHRLYKLRAHAHTQILIYFQYTVSDNLRLRYQAQLTNTSDDTIHRD
jgi:hypothetical protein